MRQRDFIAAIPCAVMAAAFATHCAPAGPSAAVAELRRADGARVGTARFEPAGESVRVRVEVENLSPGSHGIHVHEIAACEPPDFASAGGHFNPGGHHHDHTDPAGHHAGDLPNLEVGDDGRGALDAVLTGVTLSGRGHHSLFHRTGSSLVIHHHPDDYTTNPSGGAGDRLACGVIVAASGNDSAETAGP
ncbi:MAG: superoxide dismutase family protein [Bryobacteraceae bacterium]|nr:superoxide dismutase family protein [Bryobacteraceae bacterium]